MKIAVIGSGISGLTSAHYLSADHEVTVFEASKRIGGHTATMDVELGTRKYAIDTGFIVFNDWTYPNFIALLEGLGVASTPTDMGFSVADAETGLEYSGASLNTPVCTTQQPVFCFLYAHGAGYTQVQQRVGSGIGVR